MLDYIIDIVEHYYYYYIYRKLNRINIFLYFNIFRNDKDLQKCSLFNLVIFNQ